MHAVGGDHVLAPVGREAADAVEERQRAACPQRGGVATAGSGERVGSSARRPALGDAPCAPPARASVPWRSLTIARATACSSTRPRPAICSAWRTKMPPGRSTTCASRLRRDQAEDLLLQPLAVDVALLVPDHQVDGQALEPPPGVRLHHLPHEVDAARVADLQQHDRQVARDRIAPQPRLPAPVARSMLGVGAQRRLRVDDRAGQARVELRIGLAGVELAQHHLAVRPGELEHPVGQAPVAILVDQRQAGLAAVGHAVDDVDERRSGRARSVITRRVAATGSSTEPACRTAAPRRASPPARAARGRGR